MTDATGLSAFPSPLGGEGAEPPEVARRVRGQRPIESHLPPYTPRARIRSALATLSHEGRGEERMPLCRA